MWPLISVLAGVLMDRQKEGAARTQGEADIWMNYARSLDPRMSTAPYEAEKFNRQLEQQQGQQVARLLPLALQLGGGSSFGGGAVPAAGAFQQPLLNSLDNSFSDPWKQAW
jgi:hypothetical protein